MNKEEINKLFKDNPIKTIKCNDIEIPIEYLKQTTVYINGKKYIQLQQQNQKYKEAIDKAINYIEENCYEHYDSYNDQQYYILESKKELLDILKEVK